MYNPDMYIEYQFLGLAEAIESYHRSFLQKVSPHNWDNEIEDIIKLYPQIPSQCIKKIKECYNPYLGDRVAEVFSEYSEITSKLLYFKDKECFSKRVARTRNYLSHWSESNRRTATLGEDLVHLTRDLQFVLQLSIMTQLGFTQCDFANMYHTNKL